MRKTVTKKTASRTKRRIRRALLTEKHLYADDHHPMYVYLSRLGEGSARVMGSALTSIADILSNGKVSAEEIAWHRIRAEHVSALRGRLQELYAPATANRYLTALRAVLKEAWRLELMEREVIDRALDIPPVKGKREPKGRAVRHDELRCLFTTCADDKNRAAGVRDAAILALLYGGGLRRAEASIVELKDLDIGTGALRVRGKGNKERVIYLPAGTLRAINAWLLLRGTSAGPILCHAGKTGKIRPSSISPQLIYHVVQKRHLESGVKPFTPHDMRRAHITTLLDKGVDIATVARQVGHSNVQTTARYDRRKQRALQRAAERLDVPFG